MKIPLFIVNIVSAILLINLAFSEPSITGAAVALNEGKSIMAGPVVFANIFVVAVIVFDIYFYMKSKRK
jgi:hypothetical protein